MNKIKLSAENSGQKINKHIYGHFAEHLGRCIYDGIWVGEDSTIPNIDGIRTDIVEALKHINIPNLRWPGGCFADTYNWRDGIGPREDRPYTINMWGNVPENNHFGTHEFMALCELLECDPYIAGNVGGGTVREMRDWVEYLTASDHTTLSDQRRANGREEAWAVPFWGIGNENWGCGGNMTAEFYADLYCQFQNFVTNYGDSPMMKIAAGYGGADFDGTGLDIFLERITNRRHKVKTDGVSLHYYVYLREKMEHSSTDFDENDWFTVMKMGYDIKEAIVKHVAVMDKYDPEKRMWLVVDEWGTWYPADPGTNPAFLYQQNTMRDAVVAAMTLHIFQDHADRVQMAQIAQTVNVLQAMVLTEGEKMLLTPTYHVFEMFKGHQDATLIPLEIETDTYSNGTDSLPSVSASASRSESGEILLTLANLKPSEGATVTVDVSDLEISDMQGRVLVADDIRAHNTFDEPEAVTPQAFDGASLAGGELTIQMPAASVVALTLK